jgi:hypothetical protein
MKRLKLPPKDRSCAISLAIISRVLDFSLPAMPALDPWLMPCVIMS